MLAPLAPHVAEELWARLGHDASLAHGPFPVADERWLVAETVEYPIQVNGKVRSRVDRAGRRGRATPCRPPRWPRRRSSRRWTAATPRKVIVVPGRLVNVVV